MGFGFWVLGFGLRVRGFGGCTEFSREFREIREFREFSEFTEFRFMALGVSHLEPWAQKPKQNPGHNAYRVLKRGRFTLGNLREP